MTLDAIFLIFALIDGIAFANLANDYTDCFECSSVFFYACSVKNSYLF